MRRVAQSGDSLTVPRIVPLDRASAFHGNGWLGLSRSRATVLKGLEIYPLFAGFLGLAILLGALSLTWYREGR